jgi:hypothetical protein
MSDYWADDDDVVLERLLLTKRRPHKRCVDKRENITMSADNINVENKSEVNINAHLTFKVDVTVVRKMVVTAERYRVEVAALPELLRTLMGMVASQNLTGAQKHRLVMIVVTECTLCHVHDESVRDQLGLMVEQMIDTYYLLAKGSHVFQGASATCSCV